MDKQMNRLIKPLVGGMMAVILLTSCNKKTTPEDPLSTSDSFRASLTEVQIGGSGYYIALPPNYSITEKEGPDFSVYYFTPTDTTGVPAYSAGLYFGNYPSKFGPDSCKTDVLTGKVLHSTSNWTTYACDGKYFTETIAESKSGAGWNRMIHAFGGGTNASALDKTMVIFSTLRKR
ncbi:hypothetical protein [Pontibacter actiniarum]|nr:hypothetical protein [Pontibacter actiniarum]